MIRDLIFVSKNAKPFDNLRVTGYTPVLLSLWKHRAF